MTRRNGLFALLLCLPLVFLFARGNFNEVGLDRVEIAGVAHFTHDSDTYFIVSEINDLGRFITAPNAWRGRPLHIFASAGLASMLSPVAAIVRAPLRGHIVGSPAGNVMRKLPVYVGLTAFNFAVLAITLALALQLTGGPDRLLAFALGAAIATSDLVHGLFWTQHSNVMNILVPIGCIFYAVLGCRAREMNRRKLAVAGLGTGAAVLAYPYAVIWLPAFALGVLYRDLRMSVPAADLARNLLRTLSPFTLTALGPHLAWVAASAALQVPTYYEADAFRQFVWLLDAWRADDLADTLREKWHAFFPAVLVWIGWPGLAALAAATVLLASRTARSSLATSPAPSPATWIGDPILLAVLVTVLGMLSFNFLQGFYVPRLVSGIALALFVALARSAEISGRERLGACALLALSAGQIVDAFMRPPISYP